VLVILHLIAIDPSTSLDLRRELVAAIDVVCESISSGADISSEIVRFCLFCCGSIIQLSLFKGKQYLQQVARPHYSPHASEQIIFRVIPGWWLVVYLATREMASILLDSWGKYDACCK
jgi:hypothetical protein